MAMSSYPFDLFSGLSKTKVSPSKSKEIAGLKLSLIDATKGTSNGVKASSEQRDKVNKIVNSLEKLNAVSNIASSPLMTGNWRLLYTTNDGSSAGKLGPFVGRVDQDVDISERKYINYVRIGGGAIQGALTATWDNRSGKLWTVKFQEIVLSVFGIPVTKKSLEGTVGTWRMSYIDDDLRILYAIGGKNTVKENVYILARDKF
jgi:PAP_fibrillin